MQLVVVTAVNAAVSAATIIFANTCQKFFLSIIVLFLISNLTKTKKTLFDVCMFRWNFVLSAMSLSLKVNFYA